MATKKIIFFTAGIEPTAGETTAINKLAARTAADYSLVIRNRLQSGVGESVEDCDYVAGTLPASGDYDAIDVIDEDAIPAQNLLATQAIVADGDALAIGVTGAYTDTVTFVVADGAITDIVLS